MKTSPSGRAALTLREGVRYKAYRDTQGIWTIGVGHVSYAPYFTRWSTWTASQVDAALASDLVKFEDAVNAAVKVPISQNAFDACVSLAFNIGIGGFTGSTVVHKINAGDMKGAADAFLLWDKPAVLLTRRLSERTQFLRQDPA